MKTFTGFNYDFKMKNVTFENVHNTGRMFILEIWNLGSKYSRYSMTDIYFKNVNSDKGMFRFYGGQQVEIGGIHIDNITLLTDTHALQIENVSSLQLHNITIKNVTPPNLYTNSVFHLNSFANSEVDVSTIEMSNLVISGAENLFNVDTNDGAIYTISDVYFHDIQLDNGVTGIDFTSFTTAKFSNFYFRNVTPIDDKDTENELISFNNMWNTGNGNITMTNITVVECSVRFMSIANLGQSKTIDYHMTFTDINIIDSQFEYKTDVLVFGNIKSEGIFQVTLDQWTLNNLTFSRGGSIMLFGHQSHEGVLVKNSEFTDITNSGIVIESSDQTVVNTLPTKVTLVNITATENNMMETRFISAFTGAYLQITD